MTNMRWHLAFIAFIAILLVIGIALNIGALGQVTGVALGVASQPHAWIPAIILGLASNHISWVFGGSFLIGVTLSALLGWPFFSVIIAVCTIAVLANMARLASTKK